MVGPADIFGWSISLGALVFGVFGFLYAVFAAASWTVTPEHPNRPSVVHKIQRVCWILVGMLAVNALIAFTVSVQISCAAGEGLLWAQTWATWVLLAAFPAVAAHLARGMK